MKKIAKTTLLFGGVVLCLLVFNLSKDQELDKNVSPSSSSEPEPQLSMDANRPLVTDKTNPSNKHHMDSGASDSSVALDYIVECDLTQIKGYDRISNSAIFDTFATSSSVDKQLAYALFSELTERTTRLEKLLSFNQQFPGNAIALEQTLGLCTEVNEHPNCNQQLVEQAISVGGDNGAMWFAIASYYASRDEPELIKHAFRQINSAPLYTESFADYIGLYVDSLQGRPNENFSSNVLSAYSAVAEQPSFFNIISKLCTEKPKQDEEFLLLCLSLGETMELRGKTNLTQMIGTAYQEVIYDLEGNEAALDELAQRRDKNEVALPLFNKATNLTLFDQRLFRSWLNNVRDLGEQAAAQLVIEEAIELSKNPFYDPCQ